MPAAETFTLTPKVMAAIAKLQINRAKTGNWLDEVMSDADLGSQIEDLVKTEFESWGRFFVAVANFLKENNYLPEPEQPEDEGSFDSLDMMEERNW